MTDGSAFRAAREEFRHAFEMTVIDLPRNMLINFPHLLADVNVVLLTTEMTLASARDAIRILSWLKTNAPHATPLVVANKVQQGAGEINKADFEASIERKINFSIPFDQRARWNAAKLGQTFADANRSTKAASVIRDIANAVIGTGAKMPRRCQWPGQVPPGQVRTSSRSCPKRASRPPRRPPSDLRGSGSRDAYDPAALSRPSDALGKAEPENVIVQLLLFAVGLMTALGLAYAAFAGPSAAKEGARRLQGVRIATRKARSTGRIAAEEGDRVAQAQMHKIAGSGSRIEALALRLHRSGKKCRLHNTSTPRSASRWP